MKKKKYILITVLIVLILMLLSACAYKKAAAVNSTNIENSDENQNKDIIAWGEVKYNDIYAINIDFPSSVESINVKEGDIVGLNDPLASLNINEYEINVQNLQHQLSINKTSLEGITQDTSALQLEISQLKSDIASKTQEFNNGTKPELKLLNNSLNRINKEITDAKEDLTTYKTLFDEGVISQTEFDKYSDVLNQKEKAKIDIENNINITKRTLTDELDRLKTSLKYKQVQLEQLNTNNSENIKKQNESIEVAQNNLNIIKNKGKKSYLSKNIIISNIEYGIVKNISVINGSLFGAQNASPHVMDIIDGNTIFINAEVPEEFINSISEESEVKIIPTAYQDISISGHVSQISNMAIEKDGERIINVEVTPNDTNHILKPGYTADVYFSKK